MIYLWLAILASGFGSGAFITHQMDSTRYESLKQAVILQNQTAASQLALAHANIAAATQHAQDTNAQLEASRGFAINTITLSLLLHGCSRPVGQVVQAPCQKVQPPKHLLDKPQAPDFQKSLMDFLKANSTGPTN